MALNIYGTKWNVWKKRFIPGLKPNHHIVILKEDDNNNNNNDKSSHSICDCEKYTKSKFYCDHIKVAKYIQLKLAKEKS